ncbi:MAG: hypothetical protein M1469_10795 [Bacteroidetes bacterium]|nr:hypothetical protein [Bacteroidota bacterium]MCL5268573.1 hypothetical protein [Bacteroidota bacterium]
MIRKALSWIAFIVIAIITVSIANNLLTYRVSREAGVQFGPYSEYSGVIGIRTEYSDGSGTYRGIGKTCDSLGLDFAIITDRNTVHPMKANLAHRFGITLIIPAVEISSPEQSGHFFVIGDSVPLLPGSGITVDSVRHNALSKGDMVILTRGNVYANGLNRNTSEFTGMEIYNFANGWRSDLNFLGINKLIATYCVYGFQSKALNYLLQYPGREMKEFDDLTRVRKVVGIGSLNAIANVGLGKKTSLHIPSYASQFNLVHNIIVTKVQFNGRYEHDREVLLAALRNGNCFVAFSGLEHARGFLFTAASDTTVVMMGDSIRLNGNVRLNIEMPDSNQVETQVVRNGAVIKTYNDVGSISFTVSSPGAYRVQAFQKRTMLPFFTKRSFPWILSNPIYVYR